MLRLALIIALVLFAFAGPFAALRMPWAVRLWKRLRLFLLVYVLVIIVVTIFGLVTRWDAIYG